jgi:RNA polymerase sigma-70 factor, ECF subfamily
VHRSRYATFVLLVEGYSADLYRYAVWLCGDRAIAEDMVQETFTRAWRSVDSVRREGAAKPWLFGLLRHEHARTHARRAALAAQFDAEGPTEHGRYNRGTEVFVLRRALSALAPQDREPLALQVIGGLSCSDIARLLGIDASEVMSRILRSRRYLRDTLSEARPGDSRKARA